MQNLIKNIVYVNLILHSDLYCISKNVSIIKKENFISSIANKVLLEFISV